MKLTNFIPAAADESDSSEGTIPYSQNDLFNGPSVGPKF